MRFLLRTRLFCSPGVATPSADLTVLSARKNKGESPLRTPLHMTVVSLNEIISYARKKKVAAER
ncbi:hypothetical protein, partial [Candidatus Hakubella thermalkaliphila]